jgi:HKD family nuclease
MQYIGGTEQGPLEAVRGLLEGSERVRAAVAYVKQTGVRLIASEVRALSRRGGLRLLTTFDFGITEPAALDALLDLGAEVRIARYSGRAYHPKLYLGDGAGGSALLMGSANLTGGALLRNVEAGLALSDGEAGAVVDSARAHWEHLWAAPQVAPYVRGTILAQPPPRQRRVEVVPPGQVPLAAGLPPPPDFPAVWTDIEALCARTSQVRTASGVVNHLLGFDRRHGVQVGTGRSPKGEWIPPWMFEVVVAWLQVHQELRLNTPRGSGIPDGTRFLRVHRSSAVFAILGQLRWFQLRPRPAATLVRCW